MSDGFINLNKPAGLSSHDAVNRLRKIFSTRKVGHAGTLDPGASGVLPVALGRATKFINFLRDDKSYRAEILFGTATDSGDLDGEVIARAENFFMPTADALVAAAQSFVGEIEQTPPKFSAIKIHGRKAYDLARKNIAFDMPSRRVKIFRVELVALGENSATVDVDCGKGTYIRSLAVDLGARLNLPATLKSLVRTRCGGFRLSDALTFDDLDAEKILPVDECLSHLPAFELPEHRVRAFVNGLPTTLHAADENFLRVITSGKFLGVGKISGGELTAVRKFVAALPV